MLDWLAEKNADFVEFILPEPILESGHEFRNSFLPACASCGMTTWQDVEDGFICGGCRDPAARMAEDGPDTGVRPIDD